VAAVLWSDSLDLTWEDHHRVAMAAIFGNLYPNGNDVVVSRLTSRLCIVENDLMLLNVGLNSA